MLKVVPGLCHPLHGVAATRLIEQHALSDLPAHTLMRRAGLAVAQLALAVAPHAHRIWLACGPGNNGGDGLEAALHLHRWGKQVCVTWLGQTQSAPADALAAYQRVLAACIPIGSDPEGNADLCIDALLGIGAQSREAQGRMAQWISRINTSGTPVLAIDIPSGLHADTGSVMQLHVKATHTLSLLTLKPGLFTNQGRDAAGTVWLDSLGVAASTCTDFHPTAMLLPRPALLTRPHGSHKGSYGDVAVIGGAPGMTGAAVLAATAALRSGSGRVFIHLLASGTLDVDVMHPELMFRSASALDYSSMVVVCGCGGGVAVQTLLPDILKATAPLVIDADALNAIAIDVQLQKALLDRSPRLSSTVLTPHPLEAARLLGMTAKQVQDDRLLAAQTLSQRFGCTVVLKGSGSIIAAPQRLPMINPTGNARLATAGTGDVLAGMVGAQLATGKCGFDAACAAVYQHGEQADNWLTHTPLTASRMLHNI